MNTSSTPNRKIKVALVGAGFITTRHAMGILEHHDKLECTAICDISQENLNNRKEQLGGNPTLFQDWKVMLAEKGDQIDAVIICLPHHLHTESIIGAAKAGKHILCEKPLCTLLSDADEIVQCIKDTGVIYMSGHNQLFIPSLMKARSLIDEGAIGKVQWIRIQGCRTPPISSFAGKWRADFKKQGGGELIDGGYHPTYQLLYLANSKPAKVRGTMARFKHEIQGEDTASVQVLFENGVMGDIFTSWAVKTPHGTHAIHVIGTQGEIYGSEDTLYIFPFDAKEPTKLELPAPKYSIMEQTFVDQMSWFADCILKQKNPLHSVQEGRDVLEMILKATEDAEGWQKHAQKQWEAPSKPEARPVTHQVQSQTPVAV